MGRVWREKVLALSVLAYLFFWGTLWGLYRSGSPVQLTITVYDQVARPGEELEVAAKFERDGPGFLNPDLAGLVALLRVKGIEDDRGGSEALPALERTTDQDGVVRVTIRAPETPGRYHLDAAPQDRKRFAWQPTIPALLFVLEPAKPLLVCDIDDTITVGQGWQALVPGGEPKARAEAAAVLSELARTYHLFFLTARDDALLNPTREWLQRHGFPRSPVFGRDWTLRNLAQTASFKSATLADWQRRFGSIRWAIGNSAGDQEAYREAKITHIMMGGKALAGGDPRCYPASDWTHVAEIIQGDGTKTDD